MTDTEVGELWARLYPRGQQTKPTGPMQPWHGLFVALIRKLVEEREAAQTAACPYHASNSNCYHRETALWEFSIDPKTWEGKP